MNRRTFLRVLGSAVAIAAISPEVLVPTPAPVFAGPAWSAWSTGTAGPLTYEMLQRAYESCCIGQEAPNMMIVSASMARRLGLVYDVDVDDLRIAS
jgi:hypothetical protein